jgi:hypothetical protein
MRENEGKTFWPILLIATSVLTVAISKYPSLVKRGKGRFYES